MTEKFTSEEIFEARFPFIRKDVFLIARVGKHSGKQHLIIQQVDSRTGAILSQDTIDCIHVVLAEIPTEEFDEVTKDPFFEEKTYNSHADDELDLVTLPVEERFKAFKSWVAGIAEAGKDALHLQTEIEGVRQFQVPLLGRLMSFLARIDIEFLLEHLSYVDLPPEITQLSSLKRLYLEEDVLRSLPERIKHWIEDKKIKIE